MSEIIKMPHLGENASISVDYVEPTLRELKSLDGLIGQPHALYAKLCEISLLVDGSKKPSSWWDDLPEGIYMKARTYMIKNRPKEEVDGRPLG